jgi:hypothetical protein
MKTLTVQEAQPQLGQLIAEANDGDIIVLTDGRRKVTLQPGAALNLEEDSPELEAELLKAIDGPYTPYSSEEMRGIVERPGSWFHRLQHHRVAVFANEDGDGK